MLGICKKCKCEFQLSPEDLDKAERLQKEKGITKIFLDCPNCQNEVRVDFPPEQEHSNYRCPVAQCSGWVDYVESGVEGTPFWGCGECGSRWKNQKSLFAEIVSIAKLYPYRKMCYEKISKSNCIPADLSKEIEGYDEKVLDEKEDNRNENSDSYYRD